MRFAGLFDCAKLKAHGEALLVYTNSSNDSLDSDEQMRVSSTSTNASYDDFVKDRLPILAPLNYATYENNTTEYKDGYIPITQLRHIEDEKSKQGKIY